MCSQVGLFVSDADLFSNTFPMGLYGSDGKIHHGGNFFCGQAMANEVGHLNFRGRQTQIFQGQPVHEW